MGIIQYVNSGGVTYESVSSCIFIMFFFLAILVFVVVQGSEGMLAVVYKKMDRKKSWSHDYGRYYWYIEGQI